ncbi:hypothetical protein BGW39_008383 [Mortierella sp. 14UC]|nr:hypothetical protein BGW39_008383 [Mortierella sp. 14UC]
MACASVSNMELHLIHLHLFHSRNHDRTTSKTMTIGKKHQLDEKENTDLDTRDSKRIRQKSLPSTKFTRTVNKQSKSNSSDTGIIDATAASYGGGATLKRNAASRYSSYSRVSTSDFSGRDHNQLQEHKAEAEDQDSESREQKRLKANSQHPSDVDLKSRTIKTKHSQDASSGSSGHSVDDGSVSLGHDKSATLHDKSTSVSLLQQRRKCTLEELAIVQSAKRKSTKPKTPPAPPKSIFIKRGFKKSTAGSSRGVPSMAIEDKAHDKILLTSDLIPTGANASVRLHNGTNEENVPEIQQQEQHKETRARDHDPLRAPEQEAKESRLPNWTDWADFAEEVMSRKSNTTISPSNQPESTLDQAYATFMAEDAKRELLREAQERAQEASIQDLERQRLHEEEKQEQFRQQRYDRLQEEGRRWEAFYQTETPLCDVYFMMDEFEKEMKQESREILRQHRERQAVAAAAAAQPTHT